MNRIRAVLATGRDHADSLYRRQAAVAGIILVILAAIGAVTFPRSWGDPDPGLPVEAGSGQSDGDDQADADTLTGLVEPVTSGLGGPAAPTTMRLSATQVDRSPGAGTDDVTTTVTNRRPIDGSPSIGTTVRTTPVAGSDTSATVGSCHDPYPFPWCVDPRPATTVPPSTEPSVVVGPGPIEQSTTTTIVGGQVTATTEPPTPITEPPVTSEATTTIAPTITIGEPITTTTLAPTTEAEPTTTVEPATTGATTTGATTAEATTTVESTTTESPTTSTPDPPTVPPVESPTPPTQVSNCTPVGGGSTIC